MLAKDRLLDLVENFVLFDDSRVGGTRKIVARNHQVMGVNNAVESVRRQETLKREFPPSARLIQYSTPMPLLSRAAESGAPPVAGLRALSPRAPEPDELSLVKLAHPDLGRLGVFWHTQVSDVADRIRCGMPGDALH